MLFFRCQVAQAELPHPLSGVWAQCKLVLCVTFVLLEALCTSMEDQSKNGHTQISDSELKDRIPTSSINPLGQIVFTFACAKLHRLLW